MLSDDSRTCGCGDKVDATNDVGTDSCATEIANCLIYTTDFNACHTCVTDYTGYGGSENAWTNCCGGDNYVVRDNDADPSVKECIR